MERLAAYRQFIENHYSHIRLDDNAIFGAELEINGISIAIYGLNSAWTCADNHDKDKIWLAGEAQLHAIGSAMEKAGSEPAHLRLALIHHPQEWLQPSEAGQLRGRMEQDFNFLLHGHAHDQWVREITKPQHVVIAAGAATSESQQEFGYNLVQLAPGRAEVHLRRYDTKGNGWIEQNIYGRTRHGVWTLTPLPNLLPAATSSTQERSSPSDSPLSRGHYGIDTVSQACSDQLHKARLLAVFGMAGVGKSVLIEEISQRPEWRHHHLVPITAREESGIADFFGQIAPLLGIHDERPRPPAGETVAKLAEALRRIASEVLPFLLHVQRAHLWFRNGHWRDAGLAILLEGLTRVYPNCAIVLETRERPEQGLASYEVTGLPKSALENYLAHPPGLTTGWTLNGTQRGYLFSRMGGGHGRGAHAYGLALLVRLAAEKSISPYDVLKQYPDDYAQELYDKLFRDLYQNVLAESERTLLFVCSLYREGLHYNHLLRHEQNIPAHGAGAALIRRRLLTENADWLYLHDLAAEQARKLGSDERRIEELHQVIANYWIEDLRGQTALLDANIRRALEALYHLEQGGQGERVGEIAPALFGRRLEETVRSLWRMEKRLIDDRQDDKVRIVLEYLLKVSPEDHQAMRFLGECRRRLYGPRDKVALGLFRQATRVHFSFPHYWANYGHAAIASDNEETLTQFLAEVAQAPEEARNNYVVAVQCGALEAAGRDDEAATLREAKIAAGSRNAPFYNDHAKWLLDKKADADAALKVLEQAQHRGCADEFTEAIYATVLEAAERDDEAATLREAKIAAGSRDATFYNDHAKWLLDKKADADAALKVLEQAQQRGCATEFTEAIYATVLEAAGRDDEAATLREAKIAAGSRNATFYNDHAKWLLDKKADADAALKVLEQAQQRGCERD